MEQLILLCLCFLLGVLARLSGRFPENAPATLNAFVINISLPALVLLHVHDLPFDRSLLLPIVTPWFLFALGAIFFATLGRLLALPKRTIGCLMLLGGLGNTSFVGLPMIEAFFGKESLGIGVLADQPGSFLILSTVGLIVAARYSGGAAGARDTVRRIVRFVPFWSMLLGFALIPVRYPDEMVVILRRLGDTLAPLALVSVGMQLRVAHLRGNGVRLALGLSWKMLIGPALLLLLFSTFPGVSERVLDVSIFEAAMPPMITAGIVAVEHDLDAPLATLMLGIGIPLGFLTLPLWWWVLS